MDRPGRHSGGAAEWGDNGKNGGYEGHRASHDFWGRQLLQSAPGAYNPLYVAGKSG